MNALLHTDPTLRVHRAYQAVRSGRVRNVPLAQMHRLYSRACSTELLTDADDMLLERVELALADESTECNSTRSNVLQLTRGPIRPRA